MHFIYLLSSFIFKFPSHRMSDFFKRSIARSLWSFYISTHSSTRRPAASGVTFQGWQPSFELAVAAKTAGLHHASSSETLKRKAPEETKLQHKKARSLTHSCTSTLLSMRSHFSPERKALLLVAGMISSFMLWNLVRLRTSRFASSCYTIDSVVVYMAIKYVYIKKKVPWKDMLR